MEHEEHESAVSSELIVNVLIHHCYVIFGDTDTKVEIIEVALNQNKEEEIGT